MDEVRGVATLGTIDPDVGTTIGLVTNMAAGVFIVTLSDALGMAMTVAGTVGGGGTKNDCNLPITGNLRFLDTF